MKTEKKGKYLFFLLQLLGMVAFVLIFFLSSCKHKFNNENFIGPEYASAPDGFKVIDNSFMASPYLIDFSTKEDTFHALLSHKVSWTIRIVGKDSKAEKVIVGLSDRIGADNASWDGGSDNIMFFRKDEICIATLSFLGTDFTMVDSIKILKTKKYEGVLISDFDGGGIVPSITSWYPYSDTASGVLEMSPYGFKSINTTVQGTKYLHQAGIDLDADWFIGGCGYWEDKGLNTKLTLLSENPEEIYLNAFINSNGNNTTGVSISIFEATGPSRDIFFKNTIVDWKGWKLVSYKLSDFSMNPQSKGDGVVTINKLKTMEFVPFSTVQGGSTDMSIDYIIFTIGTPFKP